MINNRRLTMSRSRKSASVEGQNAKCCPNCGARIIVTYEYRNKWKHLITGITHVGKNGTVIGIYNPKAVCTEDNIISAVAHCENDSCNATWIVNGDDAQILPNGKLIIFKETRVRA